jgi:energy-coupling factor transporter transmembrane protein EcfT
MYMLPISDPSFLYLNDGSCIDYVCTSQDDPMWQLTKAKDGILKGTKEEADLYNQYDDDYCNYLKETKRYKSGTAFVDPSKCAVWWWWCFIFVWLILLRVWALVICCFVAMVVDSFFPLFFLFLFFSPVAMLINIDCQFMTCTQSIHRIGELSHKKRQQQQQQRKQEQHREHHEAEKETTDIEITGGFAKVPLYYETTTSILPLPPFLSSYLSATTRTVFDKLPSILYDFNEEKRQRTNSTEQDASAETQATHAGERSVREIIRTMDVMSTDPNEGTTKTRTGQSGACRCSRCSDCSWLCVSFSLRMSHVLYTCHTLFTIFTTTTHSNETIDEMCSG